MNNKQHTNFLSSIVYGKDLWDFLQQASVQPWMGIYLKILSLISAYAALIHLANIAGLGEKPWLETPLTWRIGDIIYGTLDIVCWLGLWQQKIWAIIAWLMGILSQLVIYTLFINYFAFTIEQRQTINGLLGTEAILLSIFFSLLVLKK